MPAPIIVVHDEVETREPAISALCAAGLQAVGFDDPMKALAVVEADTRVRVLVTRVDFGPGKLNGAALARMLRYKRLDIKTVFVALPENRVHAESEGEYVPMPLNAPVLVETVARLLTEQT
jgi:DNA-binding NtrC family response regulator